MARGNSRRSFLHVGFCGGIGLTLSQYFKLQSAQAEQELRDSGRHGEVCHLYLSAGRDGASGKL